MEEKALETMGENKASYMMKDAIGKVPADDQEVCIPHELTQDLLIETRMQDVKELKKGLGNFAGGSLQNPLGKFAGNTADDATKDFTGR